MRLPLRSVNTNIWDDTWIETLSPINKLLWFNLITNKRSNLLGIFEVSSRRASFETGINLEETQNGWRLFVKNKKVVFIGNYVILRNFLKNQSYNPNMKKSVIKIFNSLPIEIKNTNQIIHTDNIDKAIALIHKHIDKHFDSIPNGSQRTKESEKEYERERESEREASPSIFDLFLNTYLEFFKNLKNIPYKENSAEDKSLQEIINYFLGITEGVEEDALKMFEIVLDNFDKWDKFHKKQLLISEINKNLPNILNKLHNEQGNKENNEWSEDFAALQSVLTKT